MNINVLKNFLLLARTLNFTRAAKEAFIAQPALTRQIQHLEATLHAKLFIRDKRNVRLTPAGQYFNTECERLVRQYDHIAKRTAQLDKGEAGEIRIGYTHSVMQSFLPMMIRQLKNSFPEITPILLEFNNTRQAKALEDRDIDIGFCPNPIIEKSLKSKVILRDNFAIILPKNHKIDKSNFKSLRDLKNENFILTPREEAPLYVSTIESIFVEAGFLPNVIYETPFAATGIKLAETGLGITIEPVSGVKGKPDVKYIELKNIPQKAEIVMSWHPNFETEFPKIADLLTNWNANINKKSNIK